MHSAGEIKGTFTRGVELVAKQTLFAEVSHASPPSSSSLPLMADG